MKDFVKFVWRPQVLFPLFIVVTALLRQYPVSTWTLGGQKPQSSYKALDSGRSLRSPDYTAPYVPQQTGTSTEPNTVWQPSAEEVSGQIVNGQLAHDMIKKVEKNVEHATEVNFGIDSKTFESQAEQRRIAGQAAGNARLAQQQAEQARIAKEDADRAAERRRNR